MAQRSSRVAHDAREVEVTSVRVAQMPDESAPCQAMVAHGSTQSATLPFEDAPNAHYGAPHANDVAHMAPMDAPRAREG
jgi:hypothetical protein